MFFNSRVDVWNMAEESRISAVVDDDTKTEFQIAAMRRDVSEADLLRKVVEDFLDEEDIPPEVREYFAEEGELEGNLNRAAPTAD